MYIHVHTLMQLRRTNQPTGCCCLSLLRTLGESDLHEACCRSIYILWRPRRAHLSHPSQGSRSVVPGAARSRRGPLLAGARTPGVSCPVAPATTTNDPQMYTHIRTRGGISGSRESGRMSNQTHVNAVTRVKGLRSEEFSIARTQIVGTAVIPETGRPRQSSAARLSTLNHAGSRKVGRSTACCSGGSCNVGCGV